MTMTKMRLYDTIYSGQKTDKYWFTVSCFVRGAVCSKTHDSPLYIKRCSIYYIDSLFIISTADLLYRQSIYYIDSRFIISTADILYRQSIYYIDSRFIISTVDILYRQSIYYIDNAELFQHVLMRMRMRILLFW